MTEPRKKVNLPYLFKKVEDGEPITWLTCYDYPTAYLQEQAGIEMILVGDSLGMTMLGYESTLPVTMDELRKGEPPMEFAHLLARVDNHYHPIFCRDSVEYLKRGVDIRAEYRNK